MASIRYLVTDFLDPFALLHLNWSVHLITLRGSSSLITLDRSFAVSVDMSAVTPSIDNTCRLNHLFLYVLVFVKQV